MPNSTLTTAFVTDSRRPQCAAGPRVEERNDISAVVELRDKRGSPLSRRVYDWEWDRVARDRVRGPLDSRPFRISNWKVSPAASLRDFRKVLPLVVCPVSPSVRALRLKGGRTGLTGLKITNTLEG